MVRVSEWRRRHQLDEGGGGGGGRCQGEEGRGERGISEVWKMRRRKRHETAASEEESSCELKSRHREQRTPLVEPLPHSGT